MGEDLQKYWKTIVDVMTSGLMVVDTQGTIVSINQAMEQITGYTSEELIGRPCTVLDCDMCFSEGQSGGEKRCDLFRMERVDRRRCHIKRKDGISLIVLKNASVLRDEVGKVIGGVETLTDITDLVEKEQKIAEFQRVLSSEEGFHGIIGRSPKMLRVFELISNAAQSEAPIIIYGESGTGKELVANAIHDLGPRKGGPFVKVSCAALNESLLESELFGHVKGAFTGAERTRKGRFEAAHRGDIFLDEIGDIPPSTQVKLLRVLQEKEIERVGDHTPIRVDVRVLAATNRDLPKMMNEGTFREDLFYRLNVIPIYLPPLRDRREDIPLLVDHLVRRLRLRTGRPIEGISRDAIEAMMEYHWPGNIRELINVLEYAFVVSKGPFIEKRHLPERMLDGADGREGTVSDVQMGPEGERDRIIEALKRSGGRKGEAAGLLGVSRVTLWKKMRQYGITLEPKADGKTVERR